MLLREVPSRHNPNAQKDINPVLPGVANTHYRSYYQGNEISQELYYRNPSLEPLPATTTTKHHENQDYQQVPLPTKDMKIIEYSGPLEAGGSGKKRKRSEFPMDECIGYVQKLEKETTLNEDQKLALKIFKEQIAAKERRKERRKKNVKSSSKISDEDRTRKNIIFAYISRWNKQSLELAIKVVKEGLDNEDRSTLNKAQEELVKCQEELNLMIDKYTKPLSPETEQPETYPKPESSSQVVGDNLCDSGIKLPKQALGYSWVTPIMLPSMHALGPQKDGALGDPSSSGADVNANKERDHQVNKEQQAKMSSELSRIVVKIALLEQKNALDGSSADELTRMQSELARMQELYNSRYGRESAPQENKDREPIVKEQPMNPLQYAGGLWRQEGINAGEGLIFPSQHKEYPQVAPGKGNLGKTELNRRARIRIQLSRLEDKIDRLSKENNSEKNQNLIRRLKERINQICREEVTWKYKPRNSYIKKIINMRRPVKQEPVNIEESSNQSLPATRPYDTLGLGYHGMTYHQDGMPQIGYAYVEGDAQYPDQTMDFSALDEEDWLKQKNEGEIYRSQVPLAPIEQFAQGWMVRRTTTEFVGFQQLSYNGLPLNYKQATEQQGMNISFPTESQTPYYEEWGGEEGY